MQKSNKKSILFVSRFLGTGGAERTLIPLAQYLSKNQYDLTLFQVNYPQNVDIFSQFPGKVILPKSNTNIFAYLLHYYHLLKLVKQNDVIIVNSELTPTYISYVAAKFFTKPLIADVQVYLSAWIQDNCHPFHQYISSYIYPKLQHIRCVSQGIQQDLIQKFHVPNDRCSVIYVPCDLETIRNLSLQSVSDTHQAIFKNPTIISIGRFTSQKRFDIALEAFKILVYDYHSNANLIILGDGTLRPQLEQQIKYLNLTNRVFLPGFVENPYPYLRQASAFLLSSDYEGLPRVLIEALAMGCPCVATDCPSGPHEILESGKFGLLTPVGDPQAMAKALDRVLTDSQLSNSFQKLGIQRARSFDSQIINQHYARLIQDLIHTS